MAYQVMGGTKVRLHNIVIIDAHQVKMVIVIIQNDGCATFVHQFLAWNQFAILVQDENILVDLMAQQVKKAKRDGVVGPQLGLHLHHGLWTVIQQRCICTQQWCI